jgi:hypothetical protein
VNRSICFRSHKCFEIKINTGDNNRYCAILKLMLLIRSNQPKCDILLDSLKETIKPLKQYGVIDAMLN